jgi:hypothetical protein
MIARGFQISANIGHETSGGKHGKTSFWSSRLNG